DAPSPIGFADPVADLGGQTLDVLSDPQTQTAHGLAFDLDRQAVVWVLRENELDVADCVVFRVRMRKPIAEIAPDRAVVAVTCDAGRVVGPKGSDDAFR